MKEMVGGCCVCSDERGWTENPLVYCDGHGCNVAVHQACYGIVQVPTGPWYCRKCESQERQARVRCELCPQKDGALKRTDGQGWCHVVCALFVPEAWFANVQTMEPIVLKNVPPERFNKSCYICEEQGRETRSTQGSCMTCNKNGCRQNFHVTCAQSQGLLCEEAGSYGDNVKYCGYCAYHYKKLKRDAHIKVIPAFKPIPCENATPDTTPEKIASVKPDKDKARKIYSIFCDKEKGKPSEHSNTPDQACSALTESLKSRAQMTSLQNNVSSDSSSVTSPELPEADLNNHKGKRVAMDTDVKVEPCVVSAPGSPTGNDLKHLMDTRLTMSEPRISAVTGAEAAGTVPKQETFAGFEKFLKGAPSSDDRITNKGGDADAACIKRTRSGSQDRDKKKVRRIKVNSVSSLGKGKTGKDGLLIGKAVLTPGAKKLSVRKRTSGLPNGVRPGGTSPGTVPSNLCNSVFGGSPCFQSLSAPGPVSLPGFHPSGSGFEGNNVAGETCRGDADRDNVNGYICPPKIFPSLSKKGDSGSVGFPTSMEELLERQWEHGSRFLMEQSQHFDVASLLSCLHQLKSENTRMEEYVKSLTERRNQLLATNARLAAPLHTTNNLNLVSHSPPNSPPNLNIQINLTGPSLSEHSNSQSPTPPTINPITPSNSDEALSPSEVPSPLTAHSGPTVKTIADRSQSGQHNTTQVQYQSSSTTLPSLSTMFPQINSFPLHNNILEGKSKDKT